MSARSTPQLVIQRVIHADRESVFDAWLDPIGMSAWMLPGNMTRATVTLNPVVGGAFDIVMHGPEGDRRYSGRYLAIERPTKLSFSWRSLATRFQDTVVTIELYSSGEKTRLVLTHQGFAADASRSAHNKGWTVILDRFERRMRDPANHVLLSGHHTRS